RLQPASKARVLNASPQLASPQSAIEDWFYTVDWQPLPLLKRANVQGIVQQMADGFLEAIATPQTQSYLELLPQLERLSLSYIKAALDSFHSEAEAREVDPSHQNLFHRLIEIESTSIQTDQLAPQAVFENLLKQHPEAQSELSLIRRCGENLTAVLKGTVDPLTLLAPNGDLTDLTQLYQASPGARLMNKQIQQIVEKLIGSAARPLRILEIGAGTGGTTAHLFPHLNQSSYVFTDISPIFLAKAKDRFANYANITYQKLNIEQSIESQGFKAGGYDLIVASNVLHATADIAAVLERVRSLLTPKGNLILLEGTQPLIWLDLIFGMTAGWWKRSGHPLLSVAQWQQHLQSAGFERAIAPAASDPSASQNLPQSIIVASAPPETHSADSWIVLTDSTDDLGIQLAKTTNSRFLPKEDTFSTALQEILDNDMWPEKIVYLTDRTNSIEISESAFISAIQKASVEILTLVKLLTSRTNSVPQLTIVTRGAVDGQNGFAQSPIWGLARVVEMEYPALKCRRIDLEETSTTQQAELLIKELQSLEQEKAVSYRHGKRRVARLVTSSENEDRKNNLLIFPNSPFKLALPSKGSPDNLQLVPHARQQPQAGEVEIRVLAAGLNFIDVLDALALLPFERDWLGVECAGEVVAVGANVEQFAVGDAVMALAAGSFSEYVTVPVERVVGQPQNLSAREAATIPANFLTAHYALQVVTELKQGDRILIHSAAGGTGMAAVKIAQQVGAEVYATASPKKWDALREMGIREMGIRHILNSRTLDFADDIMTSTHGQGVDVVLNALSGEFIEKSLSVLSDGGRFVEIGKRDIWTSQQVDTLRPDVGYHVIDLLSLAERQPQQIQTMLQRLKEQFEAGQLLPNCDRTFPISKAPSAFRYMQQAQHIGKIVLDVARSTEPSALNAESPVVTADGTYLITGGTGGLGLATAEWLVEQGARHLALLSRRGLAKNSAVDSWIEQCAETGVEVSVIAADVANREQLASAIATAKATLPPLKGIVHAAGVLADGVLQQLDWPQMEKVLAPKVWGAWNLHQLTADCALDFFVLYSSAASLLGSPGQGSHVAANSFLDALARYRHRQGLPAVSINWGPWSKVGSAAGQQVSEQMRQRGIGAIAPKQGLQALAKILAQPELAQIGVIPIDWPQLQQQGIKDDLFFSNFAEKSVEEYNNQQSQKNISESNLTNSDNWLPQLTALPQRRRVAFLTQKLQAEIAKVLDLPAHKRVEPTASFFDMGMDSLMSVELKNQLDIKLGQPIASTVIFEYPTVQSLADYLVAATSQPSEPEPDPPPDRAGDRADISTEIPSDIETELAALETMLSKT
ncbi:MAG: L-histidine N(alpha)-methyltransferase, partial [Phormidesmis sp.]